MRTLSIGFSCQTRFAIDEVSADHRSLPFDYTITTRRGLIEALRTDGESFFAPGPALSVFAMPDQGREGPTANGLYFWHDYPIEGARLAPGWRDAVPTVHEKYRFLWARFARALKDPGPKRLVVSNTQDNLGQFAPPTAFEESFGLSAQTYDELTRALDAYGAGDYRILFLNRSLAEVIDTRAKIADPRFSTRFGGLMALPVNGRFATSALADAPVDPAQIALACGRYEDGWSVEPSGVAAAVAYRDEGRGPVPMGELAAGGDGLFGVFADAPGHVMRVVSEDGDLYFATRAWGPKLRWRRIGA